MKEYYEISIFTDGSCNNKGVGGLGVYLLFDGKEILLRKGYLNTTTPRMEMRALLEAVRMINPLQKVKVSVYIDSQFVVNSFKKGWISKWRMNQYFGVANSDLWKAIVKEIDSRRLMRLKVFWIKGHQKNLNDPLIFGNSVADALADYNDQDSYIDDEVEP